MSTQHRREARSIARRSYLGLVGVAVAGASTTTATAATAATGSEYDAITVSEDTREIVRVEDGETLENVLVDVTAPGAGVSIVATGTEWTIRNVAVRGRVEMGDRSVLSVGDTAGGTSRVENVWLGDGDAYREKGATGLWVTPDHTGHLEIERVNVQSMSDNAFYCSAPGTRGGGTTALRDCYAANCWVSQYRLSEGTIDNCVAAVTDSRDYRQGRGLWAWSPGPVEVRDSNFAMNGTHYSFRAGANGEPSEITVANTEWDDGYNGGWAEEHGSTIEFEKGNGNDPRDRVPDACPEWIGDALPGDVGDVLLEDQDSSGRTITVARAGYDPDDFTVAVETEAGGIVGHSSRLAGGEPVTDLTIDLERRLGESQRVTATLCEPADDGVGEPLTIDGDAIDDSATVTVTGGEDDRIDAYRNEDGEIDRQGLRDAVADWRAGDLSTPRLREVVEQWRSDASSGD